MYLFIIILLNSSLEYSYKNVLSWNKTNYTPIIVLIIISFLLIINSFNSIYLFDNFYLIFNQNQLLIISNLHLREFSLLFIYVGFLRIYYIKL